MRKITIIKTKKEPRQHSEVSSLRLPTKAQNTCVKFTISTKTRKPKMRLATLEGAKRLNLWLR